MSRFRFVNVTCQCGKESNIRIDQFNRKGGIWICRSCAYTGRTNPSKGTGVKNNLSKLGARNSYYKAKQRVRINHKNAYEHVEFKFKSFDEWFDELGPKPFGMTVDRIDPNGHYEPGNVRWATSKEQSRNKRNNVLVEYNGVMMCLVDAAKAAGIHYGTIERRLKAGCPTSHLFMKGRWRYKNGKLANNNQLK